MAVTGSAFLDFVIGFAVSLIASVMNAAGLNLLKLDHVRNSSLPVERQRNECGRPLWHIGLYLYITSQLAGSTIALNFLKTQWVAPLGSIALIFNFVFAKILVGTQITRKDIYGTIIVMLSVIWIVVFGGMNSGGDIEERMTLTDLKALFSRVVFVIYFSILNAIIFAFLALGIYAYWVISLDDESGQLRKNMKTRLTKLLGTNRLARASGLTLDGDEGLEAEARDLRLKKVVAMIMSACGGLLASETLLLAKSGVKLVTSTMGGQNQFTDNLSIFILFVLVFTAILQVYCLNTGLKLYDSVLVVPTFYGFYTAFGLINSTIYLDQLGDYEAWVLLLVLAGIGALIYGVRMLSAPKPEHTPSGGQLSTLGNMFDDDEEDSHELEQRSKSGKGIGRKGSRASTRSLKKKASKRQSHQIPGKDEENDTPSMYGSRRGILDPDDTSSEISSAIGGMGIRTVGGSSATARGMSLTSKSSFQSDPFRTPKDACSINDGFGADRKEFLLTRDLDSAPTHVLVDTTDDLHDSEDERRGYGYDAREEERRRQSILQSSLKTLTMGEKPAHITRFDHPQTPTQQQRPRIDTTPYKARRRESAGFPPSPGMMSPSQLKAHLIETSQQPSQQQTPTDHDENDNLSSMARRSTFNNDSLASPTAQVQKSHSARWSTGSSKADPTFEDLNPFKTLKSSRDSVGSGSPTTRLGMPPTSSSLPSSPRPPSDNAPRGSSHGRQDSFSGLPSEWGVPGRKKRHSMLFGSGTASEGLVSTASAAPLGIITTTFTTTTTATTSTETPGSSRPSTPNEQHSSTVNDPFSTPFSPGEKVAGHSTESPAALEVTPSPRTSRIMSSPEMALGPVFALVTAAMEANGNIPDDSGQNHVVA